MKRFLIPLVLLFITLQLQAQVTYFEQKPPRIEKQADSITKIYSAKLGMTQEQDLIFKSNVADYLMEREQVKKQFKGKQRLKELYKISLEERGSMSEVLTEYQYELYEKIKPELQPLDQVKPDTLKND